MLGGYLSDLEPGDVFETVRYTVTPFIVSEYAQGIEDDSDWFMSSDNTLGRQVRPPTMVHVDKMRLFDANCPLEARILGTSHPKDARMHYEYSARNCSIAFVGEELVLSGRIADVYVKRGRTFLLTEIEIHTSDGRLVTLYSDRILLRFRSETNDDA
jgi:hypothetical protein